MIQWTSIFGISVALAIPSGIVISFCAIRRLQHTRLHAARRPRILPLAAQFVLALIVGTGIAAWGGMQDWYRDRFSDAAYRGVPFSYLRLAPNWVSPRTWRFSPVAFAADTAFWTTPALVSSLATTALRSRWTAQHRRRRGACAVCGYNLTGNTSAVCPECGSAAGPPTC